MRIHLIAIGGSAMHNLAIALHINHHTVSGSDDEIYNPAKDRLNDNGLLPESMGWNADRIDERTDLVILGMHAKEDNPELIKAQKLGIPIVSYPEYLYQHGKDKKRIVIAGSHGKTTTTAMIMHVLKYWDIDFDYMVGAQLEGFDNMVRLSDAPLMILEGDEYLSSPIDRRPKFLHYKPHIAAITGIAWDHINVFKTFNEYSHQFDLFCNEIEDKGKLFYYKYDKQLRDIVMPHRSRLMIRAYEAFPSVLKDGITCLNRKHGDLMPMNIFGQHNMENLNAAYLVLQEIGIGHLKFFEAIKNFEGAARRQEKIYEANDGIGYLDFAHAPSKVRATVNALKSQYPDRELVAFLELHTFSSLNKEFLPQYEETLELADRAFVYFSPHTLKMKNLPALEADEIKEAFKKSNLKVITDNKKIQMLLEQKDWTSRNLLMMSSGTFGGLNIKEIFQN